MSFLDMQDLATVAAQNGIEPLLTAWWDSEELFGALELGAAAILAAMVIRPRKAKGRR
jgi:hypothetical protein